MMVYRACALPTLHRNSAVLEPLTTTQCQVTEARDEYDTATIILVGVGGGGGVGEAEDP